MARSQQKKVIAKALSRQHSYSEKDFTNQQIAFLIGTIAALAPGLYSATALAQSFFPDVPADYWAEPFISELAAAGIVEGYPDGTFRPEESLDRDEYAAVIRRAFDADTERTISSASTFEDVPETYWAAPAIEAAYETGFMGLPAEDQFNPQNEVSRVDAIAALVQGIEPAEPVAAVPLTIESAEPREETPRAVSSLGSVQSQPAQFAFPIAATQIMQIFAPPASATPTASAADVATAASPANVSPETPDLSQFYTDASEIPEYARDEVALATRLGLVVNYPEATVLNPTAPITRGSMAALIHQTLVYQNQLEPLPQDSPATSYVVEGESADSN
jgi:hypothetical protein